MRVWLAISGVLFSAWSVILLLSPQTLLSPAWVSQHPSLLQMLAAAHFAMALLACWSVANPRARRTGIYATIMALLVKWLADTYGVLVALPPQQAALILGDLILCLALLVGVLEALPRTLGIEGN